MLLRRALVALCFFALACGGDDDEVAPGQGIQPPAAPQAATAAPSARGADPMVPPTRHFVPSPMPSGPIQITEPPPEGAGAAETPRRDPAAELRAVVGDPTSCLTDEDRLIERDIAFDVTATVLASGTPSSVSVASAGVSEEARDCVRRRVVPARFPPFESMTTIQASVVLRRLPDPAPAP